MKAFKYTYQFPAPNEFVHGIMALNLEADPGSVTFRTACGHYQYAPAEHMNDNYRMVTCIPCLGHDFVATFAEGLGAGTIVVAQGQATPGPRSLTIVV